MTSGVSLSHSELTYDLKDGIVTITINRPHKKNALTEELLVLLDKMWLAFRDDPAARVAILTATGDVFCSGLSISEQAAATGQAPGHQVVRDFMARHPGLLQGRVGTPFGKDIWKPVIGAFNGQASAGGFLLAVHCDLRVASEDATFGIPEVKVGRGAPWVMPLLGSLPLPVLLEINVTGELMSARRLYEAGFINRLVARDQVLPTAMKLAETLRDNAPLSVQAAKEAMYRTLQTLHNAGLDVATRVWSPVYESEDAMEGLRAHAEHRKPVWKGR